jgi:hypothetical protein
MEEASSSFLKKRTKKLLLIKGVSSLRALAKQSRRIREISPVIGDRRVVVMNKSFLVLFFKNELLFSLGAA